jgi:hypothetical protein
VVVPTLGQGNLKCYLGLFQLFLVRIDLSCELTEEGNNGCANFIHTEVKVFHVLDSIENEGLGLKLPPFNCGSGSILND